MANRFRRVVLHQRKQPACNAGQEQQQGNRVQRIGGSLGRRHGLGLIHSAPQNDRDRQLHQHRRHSGQQGQPGAHRIGKRHPRDAGYGTKPCLWINTCGPAKFSV